MTETAPLEVDEVVAGTVPLVLARFRLLARRRAAWLRHLWAGETAAVGRATLVHDEIEAILADADSPEAESVWITVQPWAEAWEEERHAIEDALGADATTPLARLARIFALGGAECDLLQACLAVALDPALARVCAYLQDHVSRGYVTGDLAARLYGHGRCAVWGAESGLFRWEIIHARDGGVGEANALTLDPQIRDWLCGRQTLPEVLAGIAGLQPPQPPLASWPVAQTVDAIRRSLRRDGDGRSRVVVMGARGAGRRTFAAVVSAELGLPLLVIDADQVEEGHWRRLHLLAQRHAFLERSALAWHGDSAARRAWPAIVPPFPVQFVIAEPGEEPAPAADIVDHRVHLPAPTSAERSALWRQYVPAAEAWPAHELDALAGRYHVHVGDIAAVARHAVQTAPDAMECVREASRGRLGTLAQLLPCPFKWDDLVVPASLSEALEDIVFEATHRVAFWEQAEARRLFPHGRGLMALFSGPPGTGKTMAAEVVAAALGYDLFRVNLAGVVSKWVGETSQNFERILTRAAHMHAIILFDECDAVFSKRTSEVRDAQDKFANTDAAFLLQAIESYPGVALLATNQKGNIDPAFIRRLRYVLEFSRPGAAERAEIWRKVIAGLAGTERAAAVAEGLGLLAEAVDATGAQIKFAVLGALFAAAREAAGLDLRHLVRGLERELAKEGRTLSARDRDRILSHG